MNKTSEEWQLIFKNYINVYDADGWNRKDFANSWNEQISFREFQNRCANSTCMYKRNGEGKFFFDLSERDLELFGIFGNNNKKI